MNGLRERIRSANGKVVLLVHPFYLQGHPDFVTQAAAYWRTVHKLLRQRKTPLIVLQTKSGTRKLYNILQKIKALRDTIVIPTLDGAPQALLHEKRGYFDEEHALLIDTLAKAGARTVHLGGSHAWNFRTSTAQEVLEHEKEWLSPEAAKKATKGTAHLGCMGETYLALVRSKKFKVRPIPEAMLPHKPSWFPATEKRTS